ncbi:hypothetical protein [Fulvivirga sediminis]|uniref:Uncharacterized protein n=1 Tax=Fulvivirga sediminis TaxID=2803949 RepID=A0A937FAH3_9BACT|nr:hypothetical protein [Fulvivirga sediminis]MBL3656913.1 hypothetical protein [Fulvivirga sediminis]
MWFKDLTGIDEISPEYVRQHIIVDGMHLISKANKRSFQFGQLEVPTLKELKEKSLKLPNYDGEIHLEEVVGNIGNIHADPSNAGALFQAASQFNLLEMVGPQVTPEQGISGYEHDLTQGPACAIACGAGTIYRSYFASVGNQIGQSEHKQIDCLELIDAALKNEGKNLWKMSNGYAMFTQEGLLQTNAILSKFTKTERETLKDQLKIGVQWNTEVTISSNKQLVSQAYCSALPVAYSRLEPIYWEKFARIILEATYEATLYAALLNRDNTGCNKVFLTLVGGGAFGNDSGWILDSLRLALSKFKNTSLDVKIVSYEQSCPLIKDLIDKFSCD